MGTDFLTKYANELLSNLRKELNSGKVQGLVANKIRMSSIDMSIFKQLIKEMGVEVNTQVTTRDLIYGIDLVTDPSLSRQEVKVEWLPVFDHDELDRLIGELNV